MQTTPSLLTYRATHSYKATINVPIVCQPYQKTWTYQTRTSCASLAQHHHIILILICLYMKYIVRRFPNYPTPSTISNSCISVSCTLYLGIKFNVRSSYTPMREHIIRFIPFNLGCEGEEMMSILNPAPKF